MNKTYKTDYASPVGVLEISAAEEGICAILFSEKDKPEIAMGADAPGVLTDCCQQLDDYFKGVRHEFTFPYFFQKGTSFQKEVWNALTTVPYAETVSYRDIAVSIGNEKAIRAVGSANGKNQISIVVPCHRIIGSNGTLTGYAGGLWRKEWLLNHEKSFKKESKSLSLID